MIRCLDKNELEQFFNCAIDQVVHDEYEEISIIYEECKTWQVRVVIINYLMTQLIQRNIKRGVLKDEFLNDVYNLKDCGDIKIDEIDRDFIDFMFSHVRLSSDINENLVRLKNKLESYDYSQQIRR